MDYFVTFLEGIISLISPCTLPLLPVYLTYLTDGTRETADNTKAFVSEYGYTFPVYYDNDASAAMAYQISSIPLTLLIDADGNVVNRHLGAMDEATLRSYIEVLL